MKLKNGFMLKELAGEYVVVSVDTRLNLNGMITLNETAKTIWQSLEKGAEMQDIVKALTDEFEVDEAAALSAAESFVVKLKELDFLD